MGFFRRSEGAKMDLFSIRVYLRNEFALALFIENAKKTSRVVFLRSALIFAIHNARHVAEIGNSIVQRVAVYMVNLLAWPNSVNVEPRKTVRSVPNILNGNVQAVVPLGSVLFNSSSNIANLIALSGSRKSGKDASEWFVMQKLLQPLMGKCSIALAHLSFLSNDGLGSDAQGFAPLSVAIS